MKNKIKPSILPGFMELAPSEQQLFDDMVSRIIRVYAQNGCEAIDTPIIEKTEILLAKSAGETEKQVYRIDKASTPQALRFDLTIPFARYVVQHQNDLVFPFKRYQLGKVYRGERNQKGRYREFYQLDLDIINPQKLLLINDAYVMSLAAKAFDAIGLTTYCFQVSNRKILAGLLQAFEVENTIDMMSVIDKYDKLGKAVCLQEMKEKSNEKCAKQLEALFEDERNNEEWIRHLKNYLEVLKSKDLNEMCKKGLELMEEGIRELEEVIITLSSLGVSENHYQINLKIIRGLDYYTGTVFETLIEGSEQYGSICSGGRYDDLTALYTDTRMPGVGISIGITRLFFVLKEIGFFEANQKCTQERYLITCVGNVMTTSLRLNAALLQKGYTSEVYLNEATLKKQLRYAATKKVAWVIIIGEEEVAKKTLILKNMVTGEQNTISEDVWLKSL